MTSDSTLFNHWQTRCVRWLMKSGELTVQWKVKNAYTLVGLIGQFYSAYSFDVSRVLTTWNVCQVSNRTFAKSLCIGLRTNAAHSPERPPILYSQLSMRRSKFLLQEQLSKAQYHQALLTAWKVCQVSNCAFAKSICIGLRTNATHWVQSLILCSQFSVERSTFLCTNNLALHKDTIISLINNGSLFPFHLQKSPVVWVAIQ